MFEHIFELKINLAKSGLAGVNVEGEILDYLVRSIGCTRLDWPITYLGVPLVDNASAQTF